MFAPDCKIWTLDQALDCAERELKRRTTVYPSMVTHGRIDKDKASYEIDCQKYICQIIEARIKYHEEYTQ